ncbi:MAG: HEPN domain-containing protein [Chloroflexi bacterium]|nr:HEPN domain-containing protein [Chloroflexota bacterium]
MTDKDSLVPAEWYEVAARDFGAAEALLKDRDEFLAVSGMLLQQAVEKYLKGYLLSKGWKLVRTHDLGELLKALIGYEEDFSDFEDACLRITDFYFENRYPLRVTTPIIRADIEKLFVEAESMKSPKLPVSRARFCETA